MKLFSILFYCFRQKARLGKVAECILDNWSCLQSWWKSKPVSASNVTFCILILKKSLLLCSNVSGLTTNFGCFFLFSGSYYQRLCLSYWGGMYNFSIDVTREYPQILILPCEKLIVPNSTQYAIHSNILGGLFLLVNIMDLNYRSQSYGLFLASQYAGFT